MKKGFFCTVALLLTMMITGVSAGTSVFTQNVYAASYDDFDDDDFDDDDFDEDDEDFDDWDEFEDEEEDDEDIDLPAIGTSLYDKASNAWYKVIAIEEETETALLEYVRPNDKAASTVVIPEDVEVEDDLYEVIKVANNAFLNNKAVKKVVISDYVRSIGNNAFKGCGKLTTVTMGKDVETIGASAFENCPKLKNLTLGKNVETIGEKAFKKCTSLTKVTLSKTVTRIGKQAFCGDKQLKNVTIKSNKYTAKTMGKQAFKDIHKKAVIKVPAKKAASYKQVLKNAGISGKNQKIK